MRALLVLSLALVAAAAVPAAADHEALLFTVLQTAVPYAGDAIETADGALRQGQHAASSALPTRCGLEVVDGTPADGSGFNCGTTGGGMWGYSCSGLGTCDAEFHLSGYARYWINEGTMRVALDGSCPVADMVQWGPATGLVPRWLEVDCFQEVRAPTGTCVPIGGRATVTWEGAHAPPPRSFEMTAEVCG